MRLKVKKRYFLAEYIKSTLLSSFSAFSLQTQLIVCLACRQVGARERDFAGARAARPFFVASNWRKTFCHSSFSKVRATQEESSKKSRIVFSYYITDFLCV